MPTTATIAMGRTLSSSWNIDDEHIDEDIVKPFKYITSSPGKNLRQTLIRVLDYWMPIPKDKFALIDDLIHFIHTTSLLIDDIQDNSVLRRGRPAAQMVYGIPRTILGIDMKIVDIYTILEKFQDTKKLIDFCAKGAQFRHGSRESYFQLTLELLSLFNMAVAGQGMEIYWRENGICPTEEEYLEMGYRKTCLMFIVAARAVNNFTTSKRINLDRMLKALGLFFQINDDYLNLTSQTYYDSKGFCDDITEGKFGFPCVHAVNNFPEEGKIIKGILLDLDFNNTREILELRTDDVETKKVCLSILKKCGSFEYTKNKLNELKTVVFEEVAKFDGNPLITSFIEKTMMLGV